MWLLGYKAEEERESHPQDIYTLVMTQKLTKESHKQLCNISCDIVSEGEGHFVMRQKTLVETDIY